MSWSHATALLAYLAVVGCSTVPDRRWEGDPPLPSRPAELEAIAPRAGAEEVQEAQQAQADQGPQAVADEKYGAARGESIIDIGLAFDSQTITNTTAPGFTDYTIIVRPGLSYFVTDEIEIGTSLQGQFDFLDGADNVVSVRLQPFANYNYKLSNRWWVYGGPHIGVQFSKSGPVNHGSLVLGGRVGARHWLQSNVAVFGELGYTWVDKQEFFNIVTARTENFDSHEVVLLFGLNVAF